MARKTVSSIKIDINLGCQRIYPVEDKKNSAKTIADRKTVGLKLSREQAVHLARVLLVASQEWQAVDITAYRQKRSDGTYHVTVTTAEQSEPKRVVTADEIEI